MYLTNEEERVLAGEQGEVLERMFRLLVRLGDIFASGGGTNGSNGIGIGNQDTRNKDGMVLDAKTTKQLRSK